jgi:hypothetical protein
VAVPGRVEDPGRRGRPKRGNQQYAPSWQGISILQFSVVRLAPPDELLISVLCTTAPFPDGIHVSPRPLQETQVLNGHSRMPLVGGLRRMTQAGKDFLVGWRWTV